MNFSTDCNILIENLTPEVKISDIFNTYSKCGTINKIILGQNEALVVFEDEDEADGSLVQVAIGELEVEVSKTELSNLSFVIEQIDYVQQREQNKKAQVKETIPAVAKEEDDVEIVDTKVQEKQPAPASPAQKPIVEHQEVTKSPVKQVVLEAPQPVVQTSPVKEVFVESQSQPSPLKEVVVVDEVSEKVVEEDIAPSSVKPVAEEVKTPTPQPTEVEQVVAPLVEKVHEFIQVVAPVVQEDVAPILAQVNSPVKELPKPTESPAKCPFSGASAAPTTAAKCPFSSASTTTSSEEVSQQSCTKSESATPLDSVQLLKALKNASLQKRTPLSAGDLFNKVKEPMFIQGLVGAFIGLTVYCNLF